MNSKVDPITLAVVRGVLETTQREMTLTLELAARSSVLNLARDYSNAIFDHLPEMVIQGQDIPIHLGSLIPATKTVAAYYGTDIHPGDVLYHNDPIHDGSHICDCCMYKPVFFEGELVFWTVCKAHLTDIGGPVPAGYNPHATEIYAEGLRIPPIKLWERGRKREDIVNLLLCNMRARRDQEGDMNAQFGACSVAERNLLAMLKKYGLETVRACLAELKNMADNHMRALIASVPDGTYHGSSIIEDAGHGLGEQLIEATVTIKGDSCHVAVQSPPQLPYFINSYKGNSMSGVYLGLMMFAQVSPPYNEGLYRCVTVDLGPHGTICNAREPAPHVNSTTTPMEALTDAVRMAFEKAAPYRVLASTGHGTGINIAGVDNRREGEEYVTMVLGSVISGGGATSKMDGWHAVGPLCCFGALISGDVELLEHSYPILIHRYSLNTDSAGAGKFRGGSGTCWEVEPIDHDMTVITWGEGRKYPAVGAAGARNVLVQDKVGRIELTLAGQETEIIRRNTIITLHPGDRLCNINPGGGGYGDPLTRDIESVLRDVRNNIVSVRGALEEYGVVVDPVTLVCDEAATRERRAAQA